MNQHLSLPFRELKPRNNGLTILIDNGLPTHYFKDVIESMNELVDYVKFGWGTSLVTKDLNKKIAVLQDHHVDYFFGGTLFEKYLGRNQIDEYFDYLKANNCSYVEISNGTIEIDNREKARWIREFSKDFTVFSEVGFKESDRSLKLHPAKWIEYILEDMEAGSTRVITEARESGKSGICRPNGELRLGLLEEILEKIPPEALIFEAPNKELQTYFIQKIGAQVNLANIPFTDPIALETLRLGLRSDTFNFFEREYSYAQYEKRISSSHSM